MSTQRVIRCGVVGLGRAGRGLHINPMREVPGFEIVAVADPNAEARAKVASEIGCEAFASVDELLRGSDAELVVIATPSHLHAQDTRAVLEAGRHCVTEKPFTLSYREAKELVDLARGSNLHLFVNHILLHRPEYYHLQEIIRSGVLGPIFHIRAFWSSYTRRRDWQTLKANGGGMLNNLAPHVLSMALPMLGAPVSSVFADLRHIKDAGDAEDHVHLVLRTGDGTSADIVLSSSIALSGGPRWMLCGRYGTLTCNGAVSKLRYYDPKEIAEIEADESLVGRALGETLPWVEKEVPVGSVAPPPSFYENVREVILGHAAPVVTPESAAEVVRVSEMAKDFAGA